MLIKAISVRQPWANAILLGKDVENRSRYYKHRGLLLIHASKQVDRDALQDPRILRLPINDLILGHLIGVVNLVDCVPLSRSRWADPESNWKLILEDPRPLLHPVPYLGQLSLFSVDEKLLRDVLPAGFEEDARAGMLF